MVLSPQLARNSEEVAVRGSTLLFRCGEAAEESEMPDLVAELEHELMNRDIPVFRVGDTVMVSVLVKEGEKERIQLFQGVVIARHQGRNRSTCTVRKVSGGVGVERVFPLFSPLVQKIEVIKSGKVRRAKLYYLRDRRGKAARLKERRQRPKK